MPPRTGRDSRRKRGQYRQRHTEDGEEGERREGLARRERRRPDESVGEEGEQREEHGADVDERRVEGGNEGDAALLAELVVARALEAGPVRDAAE